MNEQHLVFVEDGPWRLMSGDGSTPAALVPSPHDGTIDDQVAAIKQQLESVGAGESPLVLALPSAWCLSAAIRTDALGRGERQQALKYRLEEHLPIAAEDIVADYIRLEDSLALGVSVELGRLQPVVDAFEAAGLKVRHICPTALLAAGYAVDQRERCDGILIGSAAGESDGCYDLIELQNGKPALWWWLAKDASAVIERLGAWALPQGERKRLALIGCQQTVRERLIALGQIEAIDSQIDRHEAVAKHVAAMLKGGKSPWIDFRSGSLSAPDRSHGFRTPLAGLVAAVVFLLCCLAGALLWRGHQYDALSQQYLQQQTRVFRDAMPNQSAPRNPKGRLTSEQRKLAALGGQTSEDAKAVSLQPVSALVQLRDVLHSLPTQMRYRIIDLSIQPDMIRVEGQAQSHADAESLAAALRQSGEYNVEPPKTEALKDRGVAFIFIATPRSAINMPKEDKP